MHRLIFLDKPDKHIDDAPKNVQKGKEENIYDKVVDILNGKTKPESTDKAEENKVLKISKTKENSFSEDTIDLDNTLKVTQSKTGASGDMAKGSKDNDNLSNTVAEDKDESNQGNWRYSSFFFN